METLEQGRKMHRLEGRMTRPGKATRLIPESVVKWLWLALLLVLPGPAMGQVSQAIIQRIEAALPKTAQAPDAERRVLLFHLQV